MGGQKPYQRKDVLQSLYVESGMSLTDIGAIFDKAPQTIMRWMERHGIERRHANRGRPRNAYASFYTKLRHDDPANRAVEVWKSHNTDGDDELKVHRLLAVAKYGFDAVCGSDVHHRNGIGWDNRPKNIELRGHAEHTTWHNYTDRHAEYVLRARRGRF